MTDQLTEQQAMDFAMAYNLLLSIELCFEYIEAIRPVMKSRGANYALNKTHDAEVAVAKMMGAIQHEFFKSMEPEAKTAYRQVIESNKELMYKLFSLDPDKQRRVGGLIDKLLNE